jgi:hypothetical protein
MLTTNRAGTKVPIGYDEIILFLNEWSIHDRDCSEIVGDITERLASNENVSKGKVLAVLDWLVLRLCECQKVLDSVAENIKEEAPCEVRENVRDLCNIIRGFNCNSDCLKVD